MKSLNLLGGVEIKIGQSYIVQKDVFISRMRGLGIEIENVLQYEIDTLTMRLRWYDDKVEIRFYRP